MKIALICGGPSPERGISLNSARSVLDHLSSEKIEIVPFYLDRERRPYKISPVQLYSNTPSDFDFKLAETAAPLSESAFVRALKKTSLVFPTIHGAYGEDGGLQRFLERHNIPYVGTGAAVCGQIFDKFRAHEALKRLGLKTLPTLLLKIFHTDHKPLLNNFFRQHELKRAIVKPGSGGSSIGVFSVGSAADALDKTKIIFSKRLDTRVVVEPFAEGQEFTVIIVQNRFGLPVALLPTEIETDYSHHQIFDYRKKYLPSRHVTYHCPPRFNNNLMQTIQVTAEQIFMALGFRDFARFDGWVLNDGTVWFSDLNPISGMEQNSFLFQEAARVGLTHAEILRYIVNRALIRYNLPALPISEPAKTKRRPISVLFGGTTSERQVSVMSGTNVWLKLLESKEYEPTPYLLTTKNEAEPRTVARSVARDSGAWVWKVPYPLNLYHTAEEIVWSCEKEETNEARLSSLTREVRLRLGLPEQIANPAFFKPIKMTLSQLIKQSSFVFIALHGGMGENGELQQILSKEGVPYNGPGATPSGLCMDKWSTKNAISKLDIAGVRTIPGQLLKIASVMSLNKKQLMIFWKKLKRALGARAFIVKPRADGCSSGVVRLHTASELILYFKILNSQKPFIPVSTFKNQPAPIEMPAQKISEVLIEKAVDTDTVRVVDQHLKHNPKTNWIEITVGVIEQDKKIHALNPSLTVAERSVLSVEEKFQGGTGINLTPPPPSIVKPRALAKTKKLIEAIAQKLNLRGYSRFDAFMHTQTGDVMIIEINTLPALTPSTVLYQQALAETPPIYPRDLLEKLIQNKN